MHPRQRPSIDTSVAVFAPHSSSSSPTSASDPKYYSSKNPFSTVDSAGPTPVDILNPIQFNPRHVRSASKASQRSVTAIPQSGVFHEYTMARYDYEAPDSSYLSLKAGDTVRVIKRHDTGWWDGECNGRRGWFPSNYIEATRFVRVRSDSVSSSQGSSNSGSHHGHTQPSNSLDWSTLSFSDLISLQTDNTTPGGVSRTVPDLPFMKVMDRALSLVEAAALNGNVDHLAPAMACVIGTVRTLLSSSECLQRDSAHLRRDPELLKARKAVLGELAKLVSQTRKIGEEELDDAQFDQEIRQTFSHSMNVFRNTQKFVDTALQGGVQFEQTPRGSYGLFHGSDEGGGGGGDVQASSGTRSRNSSISGPSGHSRMRSSSLTSPSLRMARSVAEIGGRRRGMSVSQDEINEVDEGTSQGTQETPTIAAVKAARRTRVIHGRTTNSQGAPAVKAIEAIQAQHRTNGSISSSSSLDGASPPNTGSPIAFPSGPCTSTAVIAVLRTVLDNLLGVTAAFIGHAQLHSRTSHPSSKGTLVTFTRELVDLIRKLLTIVEAVIRHPDISTLKPREIAMLLEYKDNVYSETNKAVDGVRFLTNLPPTPSDQEELEKMPVVTAVTDTLKVAAECGNALKLCLSRRMTEEPFIIYLPDIDTPPTETIPNYSRVTPTRHPTISKGHNYHGITTSGSASSSSTGHGRSESTGSTPKVGSHLKRSLSTLHKRAASLSALKTKFEEDARQKEQPFVHYEEEEEETRRGEDSGSDEEEGSTPHADNLLDEPTVQISTSTPQPPILSTPIIKEPESPAARRRGDSASSASTQASSLFEAKPNDSLKAPRPSTESHRIPRDESVLAHVANGEQSVFPSSTWSSDNQDSSPPTPLTADVETKALPGIPTAAATKPSAARSNSVVYEPATDIVTNADGIIVGATLEALIRRLTPPHIPADRQLRACFLLTFRLFSSPEELFDALIVRYRHVPPTEEDASSNINLEEWQRDAGYVRMRVCNLLGDWVRYHWFAARDRVVLPKLLEFAQAEVASGQEFAKQLLKNLNNLKTLEDSSQTATSPTLTNPKATMDRAKAANHLRDVSGMTTAPTTPLSSVPPEIPRPSITKNLLASLKAKSYQSISVLDFEPVELARQLTLMESYLFCAVPPEEVIETGMNDRTPHLKAISDLSNAVTGWVTDNVLKEGLETKKRVALIKFFIKVGKACLDLNNFSTPRAILAALDASTISRLAVVWDGVSNKYKQQLEDMRQIADHARNFGFYRSKLKTTLPPAVPFLGLFLTDVTFARDGNNPFRPSPTNPERMLINFNRYSRLAKILGEMARLQQPYNLKEISEVQEYITNVLDLAKVSGDDNELQRRSLLIQPRHNAEDMKQAKASDLFGWASAFGSLRGQSAVSTPQ